MKNIRNQSGERGHRDHTEGTGTKSDRQGGGPGERSSMAGEQGAKAEEENNSTRLHTVAGEVHGAGTLKDGSSNDQTAEERGTGLHLGDDYRIDRLTGEQNETVRRQTGTANHEGGTKDGTGGGKSSGGAGHGPQNWTSVGSTSNAGRSSEQSGNSSSEMSGNASAGKSKSESGNTPSAKMRTGGKHQHGGEFPPRTRQDPNQEGSSAGSHS
jgi:hypothetical protein